MKKHADHLAMVAIATIAFLWVSRFFDHGIGLIDDGFVSSISMRVWHGEIPYRDFFTVLTPGIFLLHAALYELFGPSLWIGRCLILVVASLTPVLVFLIARNCLGLFASVAAAALSLVWGAVSQESFMHANYNWLAHFFNLIALWIVTQEVRATMDLASPAHRFQGRPWLIGVALGLSMAFKQNIGAYAFIAIFGYMAWLQKGSQRWSSLAKIGIGAFLVNLPILIWIGAHGALHAMLQHTVVAALSDFAKGAALPYPHLWPAWPGFPALSDEASMAMIGLVPLSYGIVTLWWLLDRWHGKQDWRSMATPLRTPIAQELLIVVFCGMVFLATFPRADFIHLIYPMSAGFITLMLLVQRLHRCVSTRLSPWAGHVAVAVLALALVRPLLEQPMRMTQWTLGARQTLLDHPRARIKLPEWQARELSQVLDELKPIKAAGAKVFMVPTGSLLYFLADLHNPTRYDVLIPGNYGPGALQEVMNGLEQQQVGYVVLHHYAVDNEFLNDYAPALESFLRTRYHSVRRIGHYEILALNASPVAAP